MVVLESMRAGAQGDDRLARVQVIREVLHLRVGQFAEAQAHDTHVGGVERRHAGNVRQYERVNRAVSRVDGEKHRALEAMAHGQDSGQHRQPFLGAILLVAGEEDDVLALPGSRFALVNDPIRCVGPPGEGERQQRHTHAQMSADLHARVLSLALRMTSAVELEAHQANTVTQ